MNKQIGKLNKKVIELLDLEYKSEIPIILGDSNIEHMKRQHPNDYEKYGQDIKEIINHPTYVAKNPNQGSIEYIKEYKIGYNRGYYQNPNIEKIKQVTYDEIKKYLPTKVYVLGFDNAY